MITFIKVVFPANDICYTIITRVFSFIIIRLGTELITKNHYVVKATTVIIGNIEI